jgi:hypothetical protein
MDFIFDLIQHAAVALLSLGAIPDIVDKTIEIFTSYEGTSHPTEDCSN